MAFLQSVSNNQPIQDIIYVPLALLRSPRVTFSRDRDLTDVSIVAWNKKLQSAYV